MQRTTVQLSALMTRVAAGDRAAFADVYAATSAKLYGVVLRILKRPELADEVLQETYVRIWHSAGRFDATRASPITWMATIARNRALDEVRKAAPLSHEATPEAMDIADPQLLALAQLELASDHQQLRNCLDKLEPSRREIVMLAYLDGMSREDLGRRFGHPAATIKTWLHRSLIQLKTCLSS